MDKYRYFPEWELGCRCKKCKGNPTSEHMDPQFMEVIVKIREELGFAFPVTSAYRCPEHPVEAKKSAPGVHNTGTAIDIGVSGVRAYKLLRAAFDYDILGIGVNQKGSKRFIHLDMFLGDETKPRPWVWSY